MIKNIINLTKISQRLKITNQLYKSIQFNQKYNLAQSQQSNQQLNKIEVLKTYLQIIPPHQIHKIVQEKQKKLQNLIKRAQQLQLCTQSNNMNKNELQTQGQQTKQQQQHQLINLQQQYLSTYKSIYKYIKKRSPYIPTNTLSHIIQLVCQQHHNPSILNIQTQQYKRKTYLKILRQFKYKAQALPLEDVVNFVYKLAKLNKKQYEIMKAAQNAIIQQKLKINYPMIKKILWAFTHLDLGSSVLYSHISKTIKIGQYQLLPLQLAQSAYMLSKVSQNAKGGYGIFEIAQNHIQINLSRMKFDQIVQVSFYMLTQNIGSNDFQLKLETQIYKKYPNKDKLQVSDLVLLLKSTSAYYFKFNDKALFNMLKVSTLRQADNSSLEQFQDILWSWGRLGKGDLQLWDCLQKQIKRRISFLKPRQIAFFYHSLSSSIHSKDQILSLLQSKFISYELNQLNQHYLIKMLLGMQKQKKYNKEIFLQITTTLVNKIQLLTKNQLISLLKVLNESDYDYTNKSQIEPIIKALDQTGSKKLLKKLYVLKISQITQLLYLYTKFQIANQQFKQQCLRSLSQIMNIPKSSFIKALFCFTIKDNYQKSYKMIILLEQLLNYGPIGYFFSPYEFPLLAYSVLHLYYNSKGKLQMNQKLLEQIKKTLFQINPVILNDFVKKGYDQAINIVNKNI